MKLAVEKFLARGGESLMLAATVCARHGGSYHWNALPDHVTHSAEGIMTAIVECGDPASLQAAIELALRDEPSTSAPRFARGLDEEDLSLIGDRTRPVWPPGPRGEVLTGPDGGLAALAIAFCRSPDAAHAVAMEMPERRGREMWRMSRLAGVMVEPGEPSTMRRIIRSLLEEE